MATRVEKMMSEWVEAWNTHDINAIVSRITDDGAYEESGSPKAMQGREEIAAWLKQAFAAFPDLKLDVKSVFSSGARVGAEWIMSGTFKGVLQSRGFKPTGKKFSVHGSSITEMRGDKVKRHAVYYDRADLLQQLGATLTQPTAA